MLTPYNSTAAISDAVLFTNVKLPRVNPALDTDEIAPPVAAVLFVKVELAILALLDLMYNAPPFVNVEPLMKFVLLIIMSFAVIVNILA